MSKILKMTVCVALAALLSGCCNCRSYQKKTRRPLVGTEWELVQLRGEKVVPDEGKFTLIFMREDNRIAGKGACNRIMGSYSLGENRAVKIGPLASTMMACPGLDREHVYMRALESATHYEMDGPMLMLLHNGELQAVFQAKE